MKKVILAYSGGLDTSVAIRWLKDKGFNVVCYMGDVGQGAEVKSAKSKAIKIGASKVIVDDLKKVLSKINLTNCKKILYSDTLVNDSSFDSISDWREIKKFLPK